MKRILEGEAQAQHDFVVVGSVAHFVLHAVGVCADLIVAQPHKTVGGVKSDIFGEIVGQSRADIPGEVGEAIVRRERAAAIGGEVIAGIIEGQSQACADIRRQRRVIVEIPEQVRKQRGIIPGAFDIVHKAAAVAPAFFTVAAHGKFNFRSAGAASAAARNHSPEPEPRPE